MLTPLYRRIGGIHWIAIGRLRVSLCLTRPVRPTEPRRGWLMLPAAALAATSCSPTMTTLEDDTAAQWSLIVTGKSGNEYVVDRFASMSDCDAQIGAWDRTSGDMACVEQAQ